MNRFFLFLAVVGGWAVLFRAAAATDASAISPTVVVAGPEARSECPEAEVIGCEVVM